MEQLELSLTMAQTQNKLQIDKQLHMVIEKYNQSEISNAISVCLRDGSLAESRSHERLTANPAGSSHMHTGSSALVFLTS